MDVAEPLCPKHSEIKWPSSTLEEILVAVKKIKGKKASGPDGCSPEIIKAVVEDHPEKCLTAMKNVLRTGIFPIAWKIGRLVLLEKEKEVGEGHRGYRPLSKLNVLGKLLEELILIRLNVK
ncbi:hypothetical protein QE152_g21742 [Popillia japonica]|uniref:Reverse transcriptase n=1 Tax=Popillia japonica TaxID=7064 RepID=A0AAW1KL08_POPJA